VSVYKHLGLALAIMRKESDYRKWSPLIDALTPEQQAEVRPWLRERAEIARSRRQATKGTPPIGFNKASRSR